MGAAILCKPFGSVPFVAADRLVVGLYMPLLVPGVEVGNGPDSIHTDGDIIDQVFRDRFPLV